MPFIEILNPQDPIPDVQSNYTIINDTEVKLDLNEDSWATEYFVLFFHTGPSDPVSTSLLKAVDSRNETLPCKVLSSFLIILFMTSSGDRDLHGHHPGPLRLAGQPPRP